MNAGASNCLNLDLNNTISTILSGSSEEDEDDIILFSDDLGERGSDSESGDNMEQVQP